MHAAPPPQRQSDPPAASYASRQGPPQGPPQSFGAAQSPHQTHMSQPFNQGPPPALQQHERSFSQGPPMQQYGNPGSMGGPPRGPPLGHNPSYNSGSISASGPPQLQSLPFQTQQTPPPMFPPQQTNQPQYTQSPVAAKTQPQYTQSPVAKTQSPYTQSSVSAKTGNLPPLKPVFGLSLEQLFERDGSAVPMVVYQCIQAVDLFGLEVEGIYRLSGTASHVNTIKAMFDNGNLRLS